MPENQSSPLPSHFKGKEAIEHVAEAQAQGIIASAEIHGAETPGHISAGADAARDCGLMLLLAWVLLIRTGLPEEQTSYFTALLALALLLWKFGRSSWLGWSRLERLHRILTQEKWEIEHHRQQEREELRVLYQAKGFEGKLLDDVCDVLMADGDRLLRVMVQEELGLSLETYQHPLLQGLGAAAGSLIAGIVCLAGLMINPHYGLFIGALLVISTGAAVDAHHAKNRLIPAIVWNLGLAVLASGSAYFLIEYFFPRS